MPQKIVDNFNENFINYVKNVEKKYFWSLKITRIRKQK